MVVGQSAQDLSRYINGTHVPVTNCRKSQEGTIDRITS